jgi:uncharacterized protein (DUF885 family)
MTNENLSLAKNFKVKPLTKNPTVSSFSTMTRMFRFAEMKQYLLLFLSLVACFQGLTSESNTARMEGDKAFHRPADDFIAGYLAWRPQTGTALGFHEYDGKVTDFSRRSLDAELARLHKFDEHLGELNTNGLSAKALYDYRILRNAIKREIFAFEEMGVYERNPMTYAGVLDVNIYIKRDFAPLAQRVKSLTAVLEQAPSIMAAARVNLAESLPRPEIETAIEQANGAVDFLGKDLVDALKDMRKDAVMDKFSAANKRAIEELQSYSKYLKEQKLPKANEQYALGREKYAKLVNYGEMLTISPEDLLAIGMKELKRKQDVFAAAAREIDPFKKPIEVFKAIQKDHPTEKNLIPDTARDLEMIRQFLIDREIITIPSPVRAKVMETPQFMRATSFASMDTPGPFEKKATEAFYYVTPTEQDWTPQQKDEWLTAFNYYTTDIVSIHEAYPGHYVQFLALNASPATKIEKIFNSYAFVEGWAHYAEQMMVDEGFGRIDKPKKLNSVGEAIRLIEETPDKGAKYRLAQTDEALLRVCRLCVSIKMHCQGMTVDEGTKFFEENCYYEPKPARQEAIRGTFDPEYLYYTVGKLEILKLRDDYRKQQGDKFSLQKFNDEILRHGCPPIRLLREVLLKDKAQWNDVF